MPTIAIIGAGCSGTLIAQALLRRLRPGMNVLLFDASGAFGPGLAYGAKTSDSTFLLNMKSTLLGIGEGSSLGFDRWLCEKGHVPAGARRCLETDERYVARVLMGEYLSDMVTGLKELYRERGIPFALVDASVQRVSRGGLGFKVEAKIGGAPRTWVVDRVVLALGHPRKASPFAPEAGYFANPYHDLDRLKATLRPGDHVGVLGSKLTAVDMALMLGRLGVDRMSMYSNSGQLPLVRGKIPELEDGALVLDRPAEVHSARTFFRWFTRLRRFKAEYSGLFSQRDPVVRLEREIAAAQGVREWQLWLDATKHWIDSLWADLAPAQKRRFLRKYQGVWMSYRHPMPLDNAMRLLGLLKAGRLTLHRGYRSMTQADGGGFWVDVGSGRLKVDRVVDATGHAGNLSRLDSPLIENLIDEGLVRQHAAGGVDIDVDTHELSGQRGIYAIGPLTQGALFYVSAMERLSAHAETIAIHLMRTLADVSPTTSTARALV